MQDLTKDSLFEMLTKCHEKPRYKVCVFLSSRESLKQLTDTLKETGITDVIGIRNLTVWFDTGRLSFTNKSTMEFIVLNRNTQGIRCHDVLWEPGLGEYCPEVLRNVIMPMIVSYHNEDKPTMPVFEDWSVDTGLTELDAFLDEFVISA